MKKKSAYQSKQPKYKKLKAKLKETRKKYAPVVKETAKKAGKAIYKFFTEFEEPKRKRKRGKKRR